MVILLLPILVATSFKSIKMKNTEAVVRNHLSSFQKNDLEAVLADYTNESILVTQDAIFKGLSQIRTFFTGLVRHFPKPKSTFELDKFVVTGELAFIVWHGETPSLEVIFGTDTFVVVEGKIRQQTFAGQLRFKQ
jgi:hypothetical protein